jgi:2,3-bisphosphoglycerate-independent phosphoglycerate mutase
MTSKPQMSAPEVLEKLTNELNDKSYSLYVVNFANPDMVGHTGNYEAAVKAVEEVDSCLGQLKEKCLKEGISMLITADHGNCDQMVYPRWISSYLSLKCTCTLFFGCGKLE